MSTATATDTSSKTVFGFWVYLMTDCVLFASLFATYAVLRHNSFGGATEHELFKLPFVLAETLILLTSSYTAGMAIAAAHRQNRTLLVSWLACTFLLGVSFLGLELYEFTNLVHEGHSWHASAFLSSFFTLVGTHGLHISVGLLWLSVLIWSIWKKGLTETVHKRLTLFSLFWHFLDIVWIFIFTMVYLLGAS